ncbi:MAG: DUF2189 domain-containing protein [Pseudomonadales bacterium]|nr:DUF2189 domain-containing protein [Pseudomonadales bacterium]
MATVHTHQKSDLQSGERKKRLYVPSRQLEWSAPFRWLALAWQDYKATWRLSALYGAFFAVAGMAITAFLWFYGTKIAIFSFGFLFVLMGPLFAFGLYDVSKELQAGNKPCLKHSLFQMRKNASCQWVYACVLIVIGLIWMRAASIIHVFYPTSATPTIEEMASFLMVGTLTGGFFSGLVFGTGAFSLPMMMDRECDSITAVLTSLRAVMDNTGVSVLWALLILGLIAFGFATAFLGLIIVLPLIGYATFHAYQDTVQKQDTVQNI